MNAQEIAFLYAQKIKAGEMKKTEAIMYYRNRHNSSYIEALEAIEIAIGDLNEFGDSSEFTTDHEFSRAHTDRIMKDAPRGVCVSIAYSSVCQICTRPLYGAEHEAFHVRKHAEQLGLTY